LKAFFQKYQLIFKRPAGTSRGVLHTKDTYFIKLENNGKTGYGEAALFRGLSADDVPDYEKKLQWAIENISMQKDALYNQLKNYSSIIFGLEQAFASLQAQKSHILFPSMFTEGKDTISINGLIWMGDKDFMLRQIKEKLKSGFTVIKLKIGAIDFQDELNLLKYIRKEFKADEIEIRVDANGAFPVSVALEKLKRLSEFEIHSIEQPIKAGQLEIMAELCQKTPVPIALDEELIGYHHLFDKKQFLQKIKPQYIILKPALHGGFTGTKTWIKAARELKIGWWITSALESNVGLNALAQFTYMQQVNRPQGLGTGSLFTNNFTSPLFIRNGSLGFNKYKSMTFPSF
jgi:o-succinylbenzoate synthase